MVLFVDENENLLPSGPSGASNKSGTTQGSDERADSTHNISPSRRSVSFRRERYKSFRGREAKSCGRFGGVMGGTSRALLSLSSSSNTQPVRSATLSPSDLPAVFYTTAANSNGGTTNVISVKKRRGFFFRVRHFLRNDDGDFISMAS